MVSTPGAGHTKPAGSPAPGSDKPMISPTPGSHTTTVSPAGSHQIVPSPGSTTSRNYPIYPVSVTTLTAPTPAHSHGNSNLGNTDSTLNRAPSRSFGII